MTTTTLIEIINTLPAGTIILARRELEVTTGRYGKSWHAGVTIYTLAGDILTQVGFIEAERGPRGGRISSQFPQFIEIPVYTGNEIRNGKVVNGHTVKGLTVEEAALSILSSKKPYRY